MTKDIHGVPRGRCTCGNCEEYITPSEGCKCAYCDCIPTKHADMRRRTSQDNSFNPNRDPRGGYDKGAAHGTHAAGLTGHTQTSVLFQSKEGTSGKQIDYGQERQRHSYVKTVTKQVSTGSGEPDHGKKVATKSHRVVVPDIRGYNQSKGVSERRLSETKLDFGQDALERVRASPVTTLSKPQEVRCGDNMEEGLRSTLPRSPKVKQWEYKHGTTLPRSLEVKRGEYKHGTSLPRSPEVKRGEYKYGTNQPRSSEVNRWEYENGTTQPRSPEVNRGEYKHGTTLPRSPEVNRGKYKHGTALPRSPEVKHGEYKHGTTLPRSPEVNRGKYKHGTTLPRSPEVKHGEYKHGTTLPRSPEVNRGKYKHGTTLPRSPEVKHGEYKHGTTLPSSPEVKRGEYKHGTIPPKPQAIVLEEGRCETILPKSHEAKHVDERSTTQTFTDNSGVTKPVRKRASDLGHFDQSDSKELMEKGCCLIPRTPVPVIEMKPCKVLHKGHVPYTVIKGIKPGVHGVYKIAYKWKTIYVGNPSSNAIQQLKNQFSGHGQKNLFRFIQSLSKDRLEKLTVFWLDENKYVHNCGSNSYLKCTEAIQGYKPMFNRIPSTEMSLPARPQSKNQGLHTNVQESCRKSETNSKVSKTLSEFRHNTSQSKAHQSSRMSDEVNRSVNDDSYSKVTRTSTTHQGDPEAIAKRKSFDSAKETSMSKFTIPNAAWSRSDLHAKPKPYYVEKRRHSDESAIRPGHKRMKVDQPVRQGDVPSSAKSYPRNPILGESSQSVNIKTPKKIEQLLQHTILPQSKEFVQISLNWNISNTSLQDKAAETVEVTLEKQTTRKMKDKIMSSMETQTSLAHTQSSDNGGYGHTDSADQSDHVNMFTVMTNGTILIASSQTVTQTTSKAFQTSLDRSSCSKADNMSNPCNVQQTTDDKNTSSIKSSEGVDQAKSSKSESIKVKKLQQAKQNNLKSVCANTIEPEFRNIPSTKGTDNRRLQNAVMHDDDEEKKDVDSGSNDDDDDDYIVVDDDEDDDDYDDDHKKDDNNDGGKEKKTSTANNRLNQVISLAKGIFGVYDV